VCLVDERDHVIGLSESLWDPAEPEVLHHACVAIAAGFRGGALAARLHTYSLGLILERPEIRWVVACMKMAAPPASPRTITQWRKVHHWQVRWRATSEELDRYLATRSSWW
jgi:hypothetical protein